MLIFFYNTVFLLWIKNAISLAPQIIYKKVSANHVIHAFKPKKFTELLTEFRENI